MADTIERKSAAAALAIACLVSACLVLALPRTAFAEAAAPGALPRLATGCFDHDAAVRHLKEDGYVVRGLGFTHAGANLVEVWARPGGAFMLAAFDGATAEFCIVAAGTGWQNYTQQ